MSADFNAIAQAIALRFAAANITPPSGEQDIRLSTEALPQTITREPTVLVLPPDPGGMEFSYGPSIKKVIATYPVRFYLYRIRDNARNVTLCYKWLGSLYDQLTGQVHLGLSSYVTHAVIRNMGVAKLTYPREGGEQFDGIALDVEVHISEGITAVA